MTSLATYLSTLTPEQLAAVINNRPEALFPPEPADLASLATRLSSHMGLGSAVAVLTTPQTQVLETLLVLDPCPTPGDLARALGLSEGDPALAESLGVLTDKALLWEQGGVLHTVPLTFLCPYPHKLGPSLAGLLAGTPIKELQELGTTLGVPAGRNRDATATNLLSWLSTPQNVRRVALGAPAAAKALIDRLVWHEPVLHLHPYYRLQKPGVSWAMKHGLLMATDRWDTSLAMPREVALALRGTDYHFPFDATPPPIPTAPSDPTQVERESAAAATTAVARVAALLDNCSGQPIAVLKNGGVGIRELRRLSKSLGDTVDHVRFWLELTYCAGLLGGTENGLLPTDAFDTWRTLPPAEQLIPLLLGWDLIPDSPMAPPDPDTPNPPAFQNDHGGTSLALLRNTLLGALAALSGNTTPAGPASLVERLRWLRPLTLGPEEELPDLVTGLWAEAHLLGLLAHGALSDLGRAAADHDVRAMEARAAQILPKAESTALFQADLTVVVPGTPTGHLAELLDSAADRESRTGAWTWRFSPASIRRALDSGSSPEDLTRRLRSVAPGERLPQPLEYLVADVARRHGQIRVRATQCCLRCDDPALVRELLRAKGLSKLGLTQVTDNVLSSSQPVGVTLATLRAAGYAPAGEQADGAPLIEKLPQMRAGSRRLLGSGTNTPTVALDLADLGPELLDELADVLDADDPEVLLAHLVAEATRGDRQAAPGVSRAVPDALALAGRLLRGEPPAGQPKARARRTNGGRQPRRRGR